MRAKADGTQQQDKHSDRVRARGFVLLTMAVTSIVVAGFLGLAIDVGRMYVTKNEAQAYADAGALAAAFALDGTSSGVINAQTVATSLSNKWNFATTAFSGTTVAVATSSAGPWTSAATPPSPATDYTYIRVTATAPVSLYFTPILLTWAGSTQMSSTVNASAVAAQLPQTTFTQGAFPFSPIGFDGPTGASNTTAPWGFVAGQQYTMRYEASGKSECAGDLADSNHIKLGSSRGFWGDNSASTASNQIEGLMQEETLAVGHLLPGVGGAKTSVASAIVYRVDQDGDTSDDTYAAYLANPMHNGQRVIVMPIQSEATGNVLGFGTFFLLDDGAYDHSGNANWCAIFIGTATVTGSGNPGAGSSAGPYQVKLVQ